MNRFGLLAAALVTALAGCGRGSPSTPVATITVRTITPYGEVLATPAGRVLYVFAPDARRGVTCLQECAGTWPPDVTRKGTTPTAAGAARADLLGSDHSPDGYDVVTYDGWPLYTYVADVTPGTVTGQALDLNGGYWYLIRANGTPIVPAGQAPVAGA